MARGRADRPSRAIFGAKPLGDQRAANRRPEWRKAQSNKWQTNRKTR